MTNIEKAESALDSISDKYGAYPYTSAYAQAQALLSIAKSLDVIACQDHMGDVNRLTEAINNIASSLPHRT